MVVPLIITVSTLLILELVVHVVFGLFRGVTDDT